MPFGPVHRFDCSLFLLFLGHRPSKPFLRFFTLLSFILGILVAAASCVGPSGSPPFHLLLLPHVCPAVVHIPVAIGDSQGAALPPLASQIPENFCWNNMRLNYILMFQECG